MSKKNVNEKKKIEKQIDEMTTDRTSVFKVLAIACGVICVICIFYLFTVLMTKNNSSSSSNNKDAAETSIQYNEIVAGSSFNRNEKEYLVVFYDESGKDVSTISSAITTYDNTSNALALYTVDLSNALNKGVLAKGEVNYNATDASELAVNDPTLIKIVDGKIDEYIDGVDSIIDYLN